MKGTMTPADPLTSLTCSHGCNRPGGLANLLMCHKRQGQCIWCLVAQSLAALLGLSNRSSSSWSYRTSRHPALDEAWQDQLDGEQFDSSAQARSKHMQQPATTAIPPLLPDPDRAAGACWWFQKAQGQGAGHSTAWALPCRRSCRGRSCGCRPAAPGASRRGSRLWRARMEAPQGLPCSSGMSSSSLRGVYGAILPIVKPVARRYMPPLRQQGTDREVKES